MKAWQPPPFPWKRDGDPYASGERAPGQRKTGSVERERVRGPGKSHNDWRKCYSKFNVALPSNAHPLQTVREPPPSSALTPFQPYKLHVATAFVRVPSMNFEFVANHFFAQLFHNIST